VQTTWRAQLAVHLAAHAYSQEEDDYVFVALADGAPPGEVELARIPVKLVARIRGAVTRTSAYRGASTPSLLCRW
jgi:hypothetical protein